MVFKKNSRIRLKLLTQISFSLLLIYACYYLLMSVYIYPNQNITAIKYIHKTKFLKKIPDSVDYLVLGDSSALYNINPTILSKNSYSAANVSLSMQSAFRILSELKNVKINKGILLSQTFIRDHYDRDLWELTVPLGHTNLNEALEVTCLECNVLSKISNTIKYLSARLFLTKHSLSHLSKLFQNALILNFRSDYVDWFKEIIQSYNGHYAPPITISLSDYEFNNSFERNFRSPVSPPKSEYLYFEKLLSFVKKNNIQLFFVITPNSSNGMNYNTAAYIKSVHGFLNNFNQSDFKIIDLHSLPKLSTSDFIDFNHLNRIGADKFSHELKNYLTYMP